MLIFAVLGLSPTTTVVLCGFVMTATQVWYHFNTVKWASMPNARDTLSIAKIERMIQDKLNQVQVAVDNRSVKKQAIDEFNREISATRQAFQRTPIFNGKIFLYAGAAFAFALYPFAASFNPNAHWSILAIASASIGILLWIGILGLLGCLALALQHILKVPKEVVQPLFYGCVPAIWVLGAFLGFMEVDWSQFESFEYQIAFWLTVNVGLGAYLRELRKIFSERDLLDNRDQKLQERLVQLGLAQPADQPPQSELPQSEPPVLSPDPDEESIAAPENDSETEGGRIPKIDAW